MKIVAGIGSFDDLKDEVRPLEDFFIADSSQGLGEMLIDPGLEVKRQCDRGGHT
jgi:hypothetical protein